MSAWVACAVDFKLGIQILNWYDLMQALRNPIMYVHTAQRVLICP